MRRKLRSFRDKRCLPGNQKALPAAIYRELARDLAIGPDFRRSRPSLFRFRLLGHFLQSAHKSAWLKAACAKHVVYYYQNTRYSGFIYEVL